VHRHLDLIVDQWAFSDDNGPQLLDGYGGSVWRANVTMVQTTRRTLDSMYTSDSQTSETAIAMPELLKVGFVSSAGKYAVDSDFVDCLENAASITAGPRVTSSDPTQAWVSPTHPVQAHSVPDLAWKSGN